jgi:trk system potassium uptake protein
MGMSWFNAVCHAMTAVSTGGFSPAQQSVGHYSEWGNGWLIEAWITLIMLAVQPELPALCGADAEELAAARERRTAGGCWASAPCASWPSPGRFMDRRCGVPAQRCRDASFTVVTIVSTTGFGTADYELWPAWAKVILALLMVMGACAGSTAGGFKVGRLLVFLKSARHEIVRTFRPNLVFRLTVNGNSINEDARSRTMFFLIMYLMICLLSTWWWRP